MLLNRRAVLASIVITVLGAAVSAFTFSGHQRNDQPNAITKLSYANPDLSDSPTSLPVIHPIAVSFTRLLVPTGDVLYMLDRNNHIVWHYSVEPNIIYDVRTDSRGIIYLAISDGQFRVLDVDGKEIWGNFMNGSAQYSQIGPYREGLVVVINMWGYRQKGLKSDDHLEYWQNRKLVWRKDFPQEARLEISGERILAVKQTKEGKEITEIR